MSAHRVFQMPAASRVGSIVLLLTCVQPTNADDELQPLVESSCIACHDENTETRLDFTKLGQDFEDADMNGRWDSSGRPFANPINQITCRSSSSVSCFPARPRTNYSTVIGANR